MMATNPNPLSYQSNVDPEIEPKAPYEEGWELIFSLFDSAGDMYAKVGGAEAFMREERASWGEEH